MLLVVYLVYSMITSVALNGCSCAHKAPGPSSITRWVLLLLVVSPRFPPVSRFSRDNLSCGSTHIDYCVNTMIFTVRMCNDKWWIDLHNLVSSSFVGIDLAYFHCHSLTFPRQAFLFCCFFLSPWWPAPLLWNACTASQFRFDCFFLLFIRHPIPNYVLLVELADLLWCRSCFLSAMTQLF